MEEEEKVTAIKTAWVEFLDKDLPRLSQELRRIAVEAQMKAD
jgi:hypothetical protein